ncbi:tripartite tricarboxylate transporter substrate binding protein [Ramlibacter sp. AW1]|uniref:Tripartite tricarboxylate transporter substrate binding protein n=1 Tax=Ramlibacter aurantiacus TaxID=2801330 RepID=A0A936ZMQ3_9BURK|nr:tripartite tricarboxylate transporter substrate binding protein [Ramlibacter aurantiacus]MBL0419036.1 tripartite tricarboxylate transporter substrate binding protein [Ramlibacter aurantiacus]
MSNSTIRRRSLLRATCAWAGAAAFSSLAWGAAGAADFPSKPITLIAPTVPGGALDATARLLGQHLSPRLGQPVVIDNRPGVGGTLGLMQAAKAPPDGHTLVIAVDSYLTVSPRVLKGASLQATKDLVPVIEIGSSPMVLVAHPSLGVKTLQEYVAKVKAEPGKLTYASAGVGSPHHLNMALLEQQLGLKQNHVPYKAGPQAFNDVLGGHAHVMFIAMSTAEGHIRSGKLVPLGVSGSKPLPEFPSVPAIAEVAPGYDSEFWFAAFAPAGTPPAVVQRLHREFAAVLAQPEVAKGLKAIGMTPVADNSSNALAEKLRREDEKMAKLLQSLGVRAE